MDRRRLVACKVVRLDANNPSTASPLWSSLPDQQAFLAQGERERLIQRERQRDKGP